MKLYSRLLLALALLLPMQAAGQSTLLQGGSITTGHVPAYASSGTSQPIVVDSGPAGGGAAGLGISELLLVAPGSSTPPRSGTGTGVSGSNWCSYDGPTTGPNHYLCLSPNATGGNGLITYGAQNGATPGAFNFNVNGVQYPFPFVTGGIVGPGTTVANDLACWNNTIGTLLKDCGTQITVGGSSGQVQYNNAGALGGFTVGGDGTLNTGTGALTITKLNGVTATLGGSLVTAGALTTTGSGPTTLAFPSTTAVFSYPAASQTLASLAGTEPLTNKTYNGNSWTAGSGTLTIGALKTAAFSNTLTFSGTDGSSLNIGSGGALGTAAFTAASAYLTGGTQITASLGADVALNNTSNYFDGPSVAQGGVGTWYVSGTITVADTTGAASYYVKLWDGTTLIASTMTTTHAGLPGYTISISGYISSPAGNLRISVRDITTATGKILFNATGNSKDSTITAFRVQ